MIELSGIKEQLDALDRGLEPLSTSGGQSKPPRSLVSVDSLPHIRDFVASSVLKLTEEELLEAAGAEHDHLQDAQKFGLIESNKPYFSADDQAILSAVSTLARYGIEARHLRQFKMAADREIGLVQQVVAPVAAQKDPEAQAKASESALDIAAVAVGLHVALVRAGMSELTQQ